MKKVTDKVAALAEPVVRQFGCELWDVEYVKEAGYWYLRVYIDRDGGATLDDCENISRALDPLLDEHDPVPDSYTFEVSSAGAERALRRPSDFARFQGHLVEVKLYKAQGGRKEFVGTLVDGTGDTVDIKIADTLHQLPKSEVANVRLRIS
ncbi:ribosome maturation factor RimP [Oscillospiraceae bacterium WX1]